MTAADSGHDEEETRRDFLIVATTTVMAVGGMASLWPFLDSLNPASDTLALSSTEIDLSAVAEGQSIIVTWRGKPVFVRHRTQKEIDAARSAVTGDLRDPQPDEERTQNPKWLIVVGVCTHLGCIPLGTRTGEPRGDFGGWFCPCHGSHYDTSARIRKGPATANLEVPEYNFLDETTVKIG